MRGIVDCRPTGTSAEPASTARTRRASAASGFVVESPPPCGDDARTPTTLSFGIRARRPSTVARVQFRRSDSHRRDRSPGARQRRDDPELGNTDQHHARRAGAGAYRCERAASDGGRLCRLDGARHVLVSVGSTARLDHATTCAGSKAFAASRSTRCACRVRPQPVAVRHPGRSRRAACEDHSVSLAATRTTARPAARR